MEGRKKEQGKERRAERRRKEEQEDYAWDLGELEPAVVVSEMPTKDGGYIEAATVTAQGGPQPIQGKAVVLNPSGGIINRPQPTEVYGGMIEPAVVTADMTRDGGSLPASSVTAEGKRLPNLQGNAVVQNPSDIGRMPSPPQYGGELDSSKIIAQRQQLNVPTAQAEALAKAGISQKRYQPTVLPSNSSETGQKPNVTPEETEKNGGELPAARVYGEGKPMPSLQAKAEALTKAGISTKRYTPNAVPAEPVATQTAEPRQAETAATAAPGNPELDALDASHQNQMDALRNYNQQRYNNLGDIISAANAKMKEAQQKDEVARRRENAFRYISGLGDTLSSVANLVGTAHDASHQQQKYNSHEVVKKAEAARKARKLEMDDLSKRLDEMKARQRELKASGSLEEAKLKASLDKEKAALLATQRKEAEEKKRYADTQAYRAERDKIEDAYKEKTFNAQQEQIKQTQQNWQKNYNLQLRKFNEEQKGNKYNFTFSDGSIDIPKEKINDANIERIYQMLPEEVRKTVKGEQFIEYGTDEFGTQTRTTAHKAPSLTQKLAAISAYADKDNAVKNELRALAGMKRTQKKTITGW